MKCKVAFESERLETTIQRIAIVHREDWCDPPQQARAAQGCSAPDYDDNSEVSNNTINHFHKSIGVITSAIRKRH